MHNHIPLNSARVGVSLPVSIRVREYFPRIASLAQEIVADEIVKNDDGAIMGFTMSTNITPPAQLRDFETYSRTAVFIGSIQGFDFASKVGTFDIKMIEDRKFLDVQKISKVELKKLRVHLYLLMQVMSELDNTLRVISHKEYLKLYVKSQNGLSIMDLCSRSAQFRQILVSYFFAYYDLHVLRLPISQSGASSRIFINPKYSDQVLFSLSA